MTGAPASAESSDRLERHDPQSTDHPHAKARDTTNTTSTGQHSRRPAPDALASGSRPDSDGVTGRVPAPSELRTIRNANH